jgi:uncharacterized protein YndB with AHSA1/START domain
VSPDRIEREIVIAAPVEQVWAVLTEPAHIPEAGGTRLRLTESGFAALVIPAERLPYSSHESHSAGWAGKLIELQEYTEKHAA